jgi:His/Glu/Gln/Arg/opine family amino acid ABC transporter permease subunit
VPFDWQFMTDPRLIAALAAGLEVTVILSVASAMGALLVGLAIAAVRIAGPKPLQVAARIYTDIVRNVPILITLFFVYFGTTSLFPPGLYPILRTSHLGEIVTVLTISLVMGGFVAEVIRQGVDAVPFGQMEAALACGLSASSIYRQVVIPQLLPLILPGLASEMINVLKSTAFAMTIGVADLMWQGQRIEADTFRGMETMTAITAVYFALSFATIAAFRGLERIYQTPKPR